MLHRLGAWIKCGYINIWDIYVFGYATVAAGYDRGGVERGHDTGKPGYFRGGYDTGSCVSSDDMYDR